MLKFLSVLLPLTVLLSVENARAQGSHPLILAFSTAISKGDAAAFTDLLNDEIELVQQGQSATIKKQLATGKLAEFFRANPPASFNIKHQGSSADGQIYAIGQLTTRSGSSFKVLLRAKSSSSSQYRIIKLELL